MPACEVEEVLYEIPGVREAAVSGTPDEKSGQQGTAVIARTPGSDLEAASFSRVTRSTSARTFAAVHVERPCVSVPST